MSYKRTSDGGFISEGDVEFENGYKFIGSMYDAMQIGLTLQDWAFNEYKRYDRDLNVFPGDAELFYDEHPEGFIFENPRVLCIL